jgi:hypothetical protein
LSQSNLTVQFLNPFTLPNVSVSNPVAEPEKYAPLIGSLLLQSQKIKPVIDFLHPKEAPKPPNYTRPILMALALLGVVCFGLYYWNGVALARMEAELAEIRDRHQQVSQELNQVTPVWTVLQHTQAWESQNVVWLDVLRDLSLVLPDSTDLVVTQITMTTGQVRVRNAVATGSISLYGMVRCHSVLQRLQHDLQASGRYLVQQPTPTPNPAGGGYPWLFRTTIFRLW